MKNKLKISFSPDLKTLHYKEVASFPFGIGRDFNNDLILMDPSVSLFHGEIYIRDDNFYYRDKESTNGTENDGEKISTLKIEKNTNLLLGESPITVLLESDVGEKTKIVSNSLLQQLNSEILIQKVSRYFPLIPFALFLILWVENFFLGYEFTWKKFAGEWLISTLSIYILALIPTLISKVFSKRGFFSFHSTILTLFTFSLSLISLIFLFLKYFLNFHFPLEVFAQFFLLIFLMTIIGITFNLAAHFKKVLAYATAIAFFIFISLLSAALMRIEDRDLYTYKGVVFNPLKDHSKNPHIRNLSPLITKSLQEVDKMKSNEEEE